MRECESISIVQYLSRPTRLLIHRWSGDVFPHCTCHRVQGKGPITIDRQVKVLLCRWVSICPYGIVEWRGRRKILDNTRRVSRGAIFRTFWHPVCMSTRTSAQRPALRNNDGSWFARLCHRATPRRHRRCRCARARATVTIRAVFASLICNPNYR